MQYMAHIVDFRALDGLWGERIVWDDFDACGRGTGDAREGLREILHNDAAAGGRGGEAGFERFAHLADAAADVDEEGLFWI